MSVNPNPTGSADLGFRIEQDLTGKCWWKVFGSPSKPGVRGYAQGNEVELWKALQAAEAREAAAQHEAQALRQEVATLREQLDTLAALREPAATEAAPVTEGRKRR